MIELAPHQRDALARILALLERHGGAILADDVGLGKSFVAAAVAAAMQARGSAVELIVPSALMAQWRDTLRAFDVDAPVITHDALLGERDVLPEWLRFGELERRVLRHTVIAAPIDDLQFPLTGNAALLRQFLWRRLESSPAALLESARRQLRFYERVIESGRALTRRDYRRAFAHEDDGESFQQILFWDLWSPRAEVDVAAVRAEMRRLGGVRGAVESEPDHKRALLRQVLD